MYSIIFTESNRKFCLNLHYNGRTVIYLLMVQKFINLKEKFFEIVGSPLCLRNISKDFPVDNMKKNRIKWICL